MTNFVMIATTHTLTGLAIGSQVENIPAIIILGILSHFVLDALPHLDEEEIEQKYSRKVALIIASFDILVSVLILLLAIYKLNRVPALNLVVGALAGNFIDLIDNVPGIKGYLKKLPVFKQIHFIHGVVQRPGKRYRFVLGIPIQFIIIGLSIYLIVK